MGQTAVQEGWQLDHQGASAYEQYLVPAVFDSWAADLVASVEIPPAGRILDVACGTGIVARHVARHVGPNAEVTGVDVNPAMLAVARDQVTGAGLPIQFEEASAEQLPFPDATFDVVTCQQGLQFFSDRSTATAEIARVTKPGGQVAVSTCRSVEHQPGYAVLIDALRRHVGAQAAEVTSSPYALGTITDVHATLDSGGLTEARVRIAVWPARFPSAQAMLRAETLSSPLGELIDRLDADVQQTLLRDLADRLQRHTDDEGVVFPFETIIATAIKP